MTSDKSRSKHGRSILENGWLWTSVFSFLALASPAQEPRNPAKVSELITWLLKNENQLSEIPFSEVIAATSGHQVLALDRQKDAPVLQKIGLALDAVLARMNAPESPVRKIGRINEASHFFEEAIREELNKMPGGQCTFPLTAAGLEQRSGYPDLQLTLEDGRVFYLDPKLYARGSREGTFRTFYFEPKSATNKVNRDAVHLVIGIEHDFAATGRFLRWELIDLSRFKVRLKAEFEGSNRDFYREEAVVGRGEAK